MPQWSEDEQEFARKFQAAMGAPVMGLKTGQTLLSASADNRRRRTTMAT